MGKKSYFRLLPAFLFLLIVWLAPGKTKKLKEKDLPEKYRRWLEVVAYIITPEEKEVFLQLTNDKDRDLFIKAFWKHRDPTPGTEKNEYKEEIYRRFRYVNRYFSRAAGIPGWKTDRGKVYMILGPPDSIDRYDSASEIYPMEIWYYHGDPKYGLPPYFGLIFYKKEGTGDYKLYNPTIDGPESLLIDRTTFDVLDFQEVYRRLARINQTLADLSLSLVPGERTYNFQPSLEASTIIGNLFEYPHKIVDTRYARNFLKYKGIVDVEYSVNYISNQYLIYLSYNELLGIYMLHYAVLPAKVSVGKYGDQFYATFEITGSLHDRKGNKFFHYTKKISRYFNREEISLVNVKGLVLADAIPVPEGEYNFLLLVKNPVSKEFTYFERRIRVPSAAQKLVVFRPLLAYRIYNSPSLSVKPFLFRKKRVFPTVRKVFKKGEDAFLYLRVKNIPASLESLFVEQRLFRDDQLVNNRKIELRRIGRGGAELFLNMKEFLTDVGEYTVELNLVDAAGRMLATTSADFVVTPLVTVVRPIWISTSVPPTKYFGIYYALAQQYANLGKRDEALKFLDKVVKSNPAFEEAKVMKARLLIQENRYEEALATLNSFIPVKLKEEYYFLRGLAHEGLNHLEAAIKDYRESLKIYDSDIRVLNALGRCYLKTGRIAEAREVLKASLTVNPAQKKVKEMLKKIESYEKKK